MRVSRGQHGGFGGHECDGKPLGRFLAKEWQWSKQKVMEIWIKLVAPVRSGWTLLIFECVNTGFAHALEVRFLKKKKKRSEGWLPRFLTWVTNWKGEIFMNGLGKEKEQQVWEERLGDWFLNIKFEIIKNANGILSRHWLWVWNSDLDY